LHVFCGRFCCLLDWNLLQLCVQWLVFFPMIGFMHPEAWGRYWSFYGGDYAYATQVWCWHTLGMLSEWLFVGTLFQYLVVYYFYFYIFSKFHVACIVYKLDVPVIAFPSWFLTAFYNSQLNISPVKARMWWCQGLRLCFDWNHYPYLPLLKTSQVWFSLNAGFRSRIVSCWEGLFACYDKKQSIFCWKHLVTGFVIIVLIITVWLSESSYYRIWKSS